MSNKFCLPEKYVTAFKKALKDKAIDPAQLVDMSSDERRDLFKQHVGEENAADVNALFESKLLLKNVQQGIINWAKSVAKMNPKIRRDIVSQVEKLDERILNPANEKAFLRDLAAQKLGIGISLDEVKQLAAHSAKLKELGTEKNEFGNPTPEYFKELDATKKYVQSLNENSAMSHAISLARNFKIASVKTPIKVIVEQTFNQGVEAVARAVSYGRNNAIPPELLKTGWDYVKQTMKVYHESGYNQGSMNSLSEGNMFGDVFSHHEGTSKGLKGWLRAGAKATDRIVIHYLHGEYFNAMFNSAFAHTAMSEGVRIARSEGLTGDDRTTRATELFKTATTIGTDDPVAMKIREQAQQDAMRVTNTNETIGSKWGRFVKQGLNTVSGPLRLGDWDVPFSKIPGSIFSNAVDVAGAGLPRAAFQLKTAITDGGKTGKYNFQQPIRTLVRTAGGLGAVAFFASYIPKQNFDEKKGMFKLGNLPWISTELLGPFGPALTGFIEARDAEPNKKYPWMNEFGGMPNKAYNYVKGVAEGGKHLPLINEINEIRDYGFLDFVKNFVTTSVAPAVITDAYHSYQAGNVWPLVAGAKIKTDAMMKQKGVNAQLDPNKVSPAALAVQEAHAKFTKDLDLLEKIQAQGGDTKTITADLQRKLDSAQQRGSLTAAEAERANKLLGTDKYIAGKDENAEPSLPKLARYNKNADGVIEKIAAWAKGFGMDPVDAFDKFMGGETIERMENGVIIVKRMPFQGTGSSTQERQARGGGGKAVKLDHVLPRELGGTNDPSNLKLVTTAEWARNTPMENYLAGALHDGTIDGKTAKKLILSFKNGWIGEQDIVKQIGIPYKREDYTTELEQGEARPKSETRPSRPKRPSRSLASVE